MKTSMALALTAALTVSSCKKEDPESSLPAATQVGANTAGCLINGQPFVAKSYGGNVLSSPIKALEGGFYFDSLYYLSMNALYNGGGTSITLFLRRPTIGTFSLNKNTSYYPKGRALYVLNHATYRVNGSNEEVYVTDARHTGQVVFTEVNKSALLSAGTYSFTAVSEKDSTRTITISRGRFDIKQ